MQDVDHDECTGPLSAFCFMTGFIDVVSFSAIFVWCGFQTGNFAQLGLAIARLWESGPQAFRLADQQALTSLITFNMGAFLGRIGDALGVRTRIWLIGGTFIQCLLTMAASIAIWQSGQAKDLANERDQPSWSNVQTFVALGFMSASLGLQGIMAKRLNTQFTTTIVLTTVWVELVTDPDLFNLRRKIKTRDHKLIAAFTLFFGAFVGRAILAASGAAVALAVAVGVRLLIMVSWAFVPIKETKKVIPQREDTKSSKGESV